ncbi:uncharacterized protein LOC126298271 [Schistocerca gregaria]|uniref:uncharacterized protein LOC126298271 n=1 Tax=Schistocerca gregaria TaxID=7010 RepID=UPI00211ECD8A|nr:uncharacterized protein LOC126298271 [Schistocerca gregaria]
MKGDHQIYTHHNEETMGDSTSPVHAVRHDGTRDNTRKLKVQSDTDQMPPLPPPPPPPEQGQHPLPSPSELDATLPPPMSTQPAPPQASSVPGSSELASLQLKEIPEQDESKLKDSGVTMSPTNWKTKNWADIVKHEKQQEIPRIPVGRGALKKVFNVLKGVGEAGQIEERKLSVRAEHSHLSDVRVKQADMQQHLKPKQTVFLRGEKRGNPDMLPIPEQDESKLKDSGVTMSPTNWKTKNWADIVKHEKQQEIPRIPVGRGALKKVFNVLKGVGEAGQIEERKLSVRAEHSHLSDDRVKQADMQQHLKPKQTVFLRGEKRGNPDMLPKEPTTETKRGAVWPSRAKPYGTLTIGARNKLAEPLTSTPTKSTVESKSKLPLPVPRVRSCTDTAPTSVCLLDNKEPPEGVSQKCHTEREDIQLKREIDQSPISLEEKQFQSDLELARQLSLKDMYPSGSKEQISHSSETVDKPKRDLRAAEDAQFLRDMEEACERSFLDNCSPGSLELDRDPEATVSPLQSDEEQDMPIMETLDRYLKDSMEHNGSPLYSTQVPTSTSRIDSDGGHHSSQSNKHHNPSLQPGPSTSKIDERNRERLTLTEEEQFLRDMELARQLSLQENWRRVADDGDSSDED